MGIWHCSQFILLECLIWVLTIPLLIQLLDKAHSGKQNIIGRIFGKPGSHFCLQASFGGAHQGMEDLSISFSFSLSSALAPFQIKMTIHIQKRLFPYFFDIYPGVDILGHMAMLFLTWRTIMVLSTMTTPFMLPPKVCESSKFHISLPALIFCVL